MCTCARTHTNVQALAISCIQVACLSLCVPLCVSLCLCDYCLHCGLSHQRTHSIISEDTFYLSENTFYHIACIVVPPLLPAPLPGRLTQTYGAYRTYWRSTRRRERRLQMPSSLKSQLFAILSNKLRLHVCDTVCVCVCVCTRQYVCTCVCGKICACLMVDCVNVDIERSGRLSTLSPPMQLS